MVICGPIIKLANGKEMPQVGLGTWLPGEVGPAVGWALQHGYRLIDTAACYNNEEEIGKTLRKFFDNGKIKREDVFITSKVNLHEVEEQLRDSLRKLQLDYVDLYLVHMPVCFNHDHSVKVEDTWKGMENVYEKGLTKAIGVSNFSIDQIERIQKIATTMIHNVQVECHLYFPQFKLHDVCKHHNISLTAYAPIGSPGRKNFVPPQKGKLVFSLQSLADEVVQKLCAKYHKSSAQIMLRYLLQRNIAIIPKSIKEDRIKENFEVICLLFRKNAGICSN
ncbi:unnamed protein product [Gongylonema pulchrum]|uniref:Aldo_ket_red domain-containing protein n=1 Tax=Gongylonema pulchrum TaxID=637853 RepID=A0A183CUA4_9BILA|nr:unnamed protein product [Gongylonema pulchrum]